MGQKGLAWERSVGQKRTGLGETSGAGKEAGQHVPRRHNARSAHLQARQETQGMGVQSLGREGPREKERERSEKWTFYP